MAGARPSPPIWTVAVVLAAGLAVLQFAGQAILWFLPYHTAGLLNEIGLLAVGLALGALVMGALASRTGLGWPLWRSSFSVGLLLYAAASFAMLGWSAQTGLAFDAHRYTLFSAPGCEFLARFPGPTSGGRLRGDVFEQADAERSAAAVAIYADLPSLTALRADCLPIAAAGASDNVALAATAARQWAQRIGLEVTEERLERNDSGAVLRLRGIIRGSTLPAEAGGTGRTLTAIDSHIGASSVMTVYVFQPDTGTLSPLASQFLEAVRGR